jgi:hypothetical protein
MDCRLTCVVLGGYCRAADLPAPTGTVTGGNQKSHWAISPAA